MDICKPAVTTFHRDIDMRRGYEKELPDQMSSRQLNGVLIYLPIYWGLTWSTPQIILLVVCTRQLSDCGPIQGSWNRIHKFQFVVFWLYWSTLDDWKVYVHILRWCITNGVVKGEMYAIFIEEKYVSGRDIDYLEGHELAVTLWLLTVVKNIFRISKFFWTHSCEKFQTVLQQPFYFNFTMWPIF